jgi:hypothetical protein
MTKKNLKFFLGGDDAEMRAIAAHLAKANIPFVDGGLKWGAVASMYGSAIAEAATAGFTPVLVELGLDCELPQGTIAVDHHSSRAGEEPSIIQVLDLIGVVPTREDILIGAMDAGFVFGLEAAGATPDEVAQMLGLGSAKGRSTKEMLLETETFSDEEKAEIERGVNAAELVGPMAVVRIANTRTGAVMTRLIGQQPMQNGLVLCGTGDLNYYGEGEVVRKLIATFPNGTYSGGAGLMPHTEKAIAFWQNAGGQPPRNAFFGVDAKKEGHPTHAEVLAFLTNLFANS